MASILNSMVVMWRNWYYCGPIAIKWRGLCQSLAWSPGRRRHVSKLSRANQVVVVTSGPGAVHDSCRHPGGGGRCSEFDSTLGPGVPDPSANYRQHCRSRDIDATTFVHERSSRPPAEAWLNAQLLSSSSGLTTESSGTTLHAPSLRQLAKPHNIFAVVSNRKWVMPWGLKRAVCVTGRVGRVPLRCIWTRQASISEAHTSCIST